MSQYNLSRPKKKRSIIPLFIVLSIFALSAGAIAAYLTQSKSPVATLSSIAKLVAEPTSSFNAVRTRASGFTNRDGQISASLEVTADQVTFLSSSGAGAAEGAGGASGAAGDEESPPDVASNVNHM